MYEAAAKDFLSKFADGDVIKLRLLQSNEFRECLEKYGAALNVSLRNGGLSCRKKFSVCPPACFFVRFSLTVKHFDSKNHVAFFGISMLPVIARGSFVLDVGRCDKKRHKAIRNSVFCRLVCAGTSP